MVLLPLVCSPVWECLSPEGWTRMLSLHRDRKTRKASRWFWVGNNGPASASEDDLRRTGGFSFFSSSSSSSLSMSLSVSSEAEAAIIRIKTEVTSCCSEARAVVLLASTVVDKKTWYRTRMVWSRWLPRKSASLRCWSTRHPVDSKNFMADSSEDDCERSTEKTDSARTSAALWYSSRLAPIPMRTPSRQPWVTREVAVSSPMLTMPQNSRNSDPFCSVCLARKVLACPHTLMR
mmetsp:Transcript_20977/g.58308  ORF Transcript_20977/g.58308 Transcript_20977/m.58308 type:complete len:234 (+) Transcript_20977:1731-2432(+)